MSLNQDNSLVLSYLGLRKAIGIIGISLPFVLAGGRMFLEEWGILSSISAYYYSVMGGRVCREFVRNWRISFVVSWVRAGG